LEDVEGVAWVRRSIAMTAMAMGVRVNVPVSMGVAMSVYVSVNGMRGVGAMAVSGVCVPTVMRVSRAVGKRAHQQRDHHIHAAQTEARPEENIERVHRR
jgi:hypothetical protein